MTTIAAQLGISRPTVYAYLRRTRPPSPRSPQRSGHVLRPYMTYLIQRWREGCTDSMQLWRETRALGYAHSARTVSRFITRLRQASAAGWAPETQTSPYTRPQGPSARAVSFTWVCPEAKRAQDAQLYVDQLIHADPVLAQAYTLSQAFLALVRERRGADLTAWITEAVTSGIAVLARFAQGLQEDLAAITAGLTLPWSNGAVEGHINRLKLLKRQSYVRLGRLCDLRMRLPKEAYAGINVSKIASQERPCANSWVTNCSSPCRTSRVIARHLWPKVGAPLANANLSVSTPEAGARWTNDCATQLKRKWRWTASSLRT